MTEVCCDVSPSFCINQQSNSLTSASIMFHGLSPESNVNITKLANSSKFHSFSLTGLDLHMGGYNYLSQGICASLGHEVQELLIVVYSP